MISILIIITGIIIAWMYRKDEQEVGCVAIFICTSIGAILATAEMPVMINLIYELWSR